MRRMALVFFALVMVGTLACVEIPEEDHGPCESAEFGCLVVGRGDPLVIGTFFDRSGYRKQVGDDSLNGVMLAADYIDGSFDGESATFLGHPIEFIHEDDRCSPDNEGDRALVSRAGDLAGVIGPTCDAPALGIADQILGDEGIPLISPSATDPDLAVPGTHQPFFFRTAHNAELEIEALARFAIEELDANAGATIPIRTVATMDVPHFEDAFTDLGGSIVQSETIELGQKDFDAELTAIARGANGRPPDVLFLPVRPDEAFDVATSARSGPLRKVSLLTTGSLMNGFGERAGNPPPGSYVAVPDLDFGGHFYEDEFLPAYRSQFGEPGPGYHALAFDATMLLLHALESVAIQETDGPTYFPRTALRDALATQKQKGISGDLACNEFGECNLDQPMLVQHILRDRARTVWSSSS